jgi:hypothetical protein
LAIEAYEPASEREEFSGAQVCSSRTQYSIHDPGELEGEGPPPRLVTYSGKNAPLAGHASRVAVGVEAVSGIEQSVRSVEELIAGREIDSQERRVGIPAVHVDIDSPVESMMLGNISNPTPTRMVMSTPRTCFKMLMVRAGTPRK